MLPFVADVSIVNCAECQQFNKRTLLLLFYGWSWWKLSTESDLKPSYCQLNIFVGSQRFGFTFGVCTWMYLCVLIVMIHSVFGAALLTIALWNLNQLICWMQSHQDPQSLHSSTSTIIIRSTLLGLICPSICMYVGLFVCPSTKSFSDFNEIWYVGRGRWVMHDGMQYDPIQGQGHEPLKFGNLSIFKSYLFRHLQWELKSDDRFVN